MRGEKKEVEREFVAQLKRTVCPCAAVCRERRESAIYSILLWSFVLCVRRKEKKNCNPKLFSTEKRLVAFIFCNRADMSM
jgi:hypothetical protein